MQGAKLDGVSESMTRLGSEMRVEASARSSCTLSGVEASHSSRNLDCPCTHTQWSKALCGRRTRRLRSSERRRPRRVRTLAQRHMTTTTSAIAMASPGVLRVLAMLQSTPQHPRHLRVDVPPLSATPIPRHAFLRYVHHVITGHTLPEVTNDHTVAS